MADFTIHARPAGKRIKDFSEVAVGLNKKQAVDHAKIYLERESSLQGQGCPLGTEAFSFLKLLAKGNVDGALEVIHQHNPMPGITGRFADEPFAETDVRNRDNERISLRALERFAADNGRAKVLSRGKKAGERIAIFGSGPSGLTAAAFLVQKNFDVHVYESYHQAGGSLRYGISEFRLPQKVLDNQIRYIESLGVTFHYDHTLGQTITFAGLLKNGFKAVFLAVGAGQPKMLNIPGQNAQGIFSGDDVLLNINLMRAETNPRSHTALNIGQKVVVIGGGNTAVDCARTLVRLGRSVTLVVRGTADDLQVKPFIRQHLQEERVKIEPFINTIKYIVDDFGVVKGIRCRRLDYADVNEKDQWQLVEVKDSDFDMEADTVIVAVGHLPNTVMVKNDPDLKLKRDGAIWTKRNSCMTSVDGVFAGGNVVDGPGPLLWAMLSGKQAAEEINDFIILRK